jgi:drug/metabolite transporter (DMT)-like permease
VILFTSPLAFIPGLRKHGLTWIILTGMFGLMLVFMSILLEDEVSDQVGHGISICGSLFLVFAHIKNLKHAQRHAFPAHEHHCC